MAIASWDAIQTALAEGRVLRGYTRFGASLGSGSSWPASSFEYASTGYGGTPTAPSTPATCDHTTTGNLFKHVFPGDFSHRFYLARVSQVHGSGSSWGLIVDRLSHTGGMVGNPSGTFPVEQTTNLPTAALTRYTDGVGVMPVLQGYAGTMTGAASVTATIRYTNEAGTANRVSKEIVLPANLSRYASFIFPLQDGDAGCRSVEGFTLNADMGVAGNLGITLVKPLAFFPATIAMSSGTWPTNAGGTYIDGRQAFREYLQSFMTLADVTPPACIEFWGAFGSPTVGSAEFELLMDE